MYTTMLNFSFLDFPGEVKCCMNLAELKTELASRGVPADAYCLKGGLPNEAYCIEQEGRWKMEYLL